MAGFLEVLIRSIREYTRDQCGLFAAGITYQSLVALAPMLIFAISLTGFFVDETDQRRIVDQLMTMLPLSEDSGRRNVEDLVSQVVAARGPLGVIGIVGTAWAASALFGAIRASLSAVFDLGTRRRYLHGKAVDAALLLGFTALMALSAGFTLAIALAQRYSAEVFGEGFASGTAWLLSLTYLTVPALISFVVFYLLYAVVANAGLQRKDAALGALVAACMFEVLQIGFAQYVAHFGRYDATYGTVGFAIALLAFLNLGAKVMLVGAEVADARRRLDSEPPGQRRREIESLRARLRWRPRLFDRRREAVSRSPGARGDAAEDGRQYGSFLGAASPLFAEAVGTRGSDDGEGGQRGGTGTSGQASGVE